MSDALACLKEFCNSGGDSACPVDCVDHGANSEGAGDCADKRVDIENSSDVRVDHFWANFCSLDQVAMPFVVAQPGVKCVPRRCITFNDKPEVRTHVVRNCLFQRQTPPTSFLSCNKVGREIVVDSDYTCYSNHSAAVARSKALDLSCAWAIDGRKVLPLVPNENEEDLSSEFVASNVLEQSCDMPRRVLFWEDSRALSFVPDRDGYASYGRPLAYWVHEAVYSVEQATAMSRGKVRSFEHHGKVPPWASIPEIVPAKCVIPYRYGGIVAAVAHVSAAACNPVPREIIRLSDPARPVLNGKVYELPWYVAAPAEGTIKIWLIDTGCGHDLIGKTEVASSGGVCRPAKESLTSNTANGKTFALEQASYQSAEFNEEIDAYVLDSTPAVISVGKRCMSMGYSFHWPSGKHPFFVCPDGMIVEFDVHGDIPYLRSGSRKSAPKTPTREILVPSVPAVVESPFGIPTTTWACPSSGGDPAVGAEEDEDGEELSETEVADPTAEYNEVEKKSLREAALTIEHKLTHRVKNVFCDSCVRGIMKNKRTKVGAFDRKLTHWGQLLTSDHVDSKTKKQVGLDGEKEAFVTKDMFSGLICLYAVPTKDAVDTEICIRDFRAFQAFGNLKMLACIPIVQVKSNLLVDPLAYSTTKASLVFPRPML